MKQKLALLPILISIFFLIQEECNSQIVINEIQFSNKNTITDNFNETSDWIELYNAGILAVNLNGYKITDDESLSVFWTFPDTLLLPGDYILVFASGRNKKDKSGFHTDFKLKLMEESVVLLNSSGIVIDKTDKVCVPPDKTLGCFPDGSKEKVILSPTPEKSNNNSQVFHINYQKDSLIVNYPSGFYADTIHVQLVNQNSLNKIYYTLDGSEPSPNKWNYINSIPLSDINNKENRFANKGDKGFKPGNLLSKGNILRAQVFSEGCPASNEIINSFFISKENVYDYGIPVVSLITEEDNLFDEDYGIYVTGNQKNYMKRGKMWEREVKVEIFDSAKNQVINQNAGLRIHGNGSRVERQKSLRLCAHEKYGESEFMYPFFPQKNLQGFETIILSAERTFSPIIFKDELCSDLVSDLNMDYQAWQPAIVFINGEYWGIHHIREYQKGDYFFNNHNECEDSVDIIEYMRGTGAVPILGNDDAYQELIDFVSNNDLEDDEIFLQFESMIDIDNLMDFYITQLYFANTDFPENNNRMWRPRRQGAKWRWLFYDCEAGLHFAKSDKLLAYSNAPEDKENTPEWAVIILQQMLYNDSFQKQFYNRFISYMSNEFAPEVVIDKIHEYEKFYEPLMRDHIYRWNYPNCIDKWKENINVIEKFALQRPVYLNFQLQELFEKPFSVYPNPSYGEFNIKFYGASSNKCYKIFDLTGNKIHEGAINDDDTFHFEKFLPVGIYLLQITMDQFFYTEKIIIQ